MGISESSCDVRQLAPEEVRVFAHELVRLQRCAYAVEAELIGDVRIPQLTESAAQLISAGLTWHVVLHQRTIVAAIAFSHARSGIEIERLVVYPNSHRRGYARVLVASLPELPTVVSTGRANTPARRLYESLGFAHVADTEVVPRLWLSSYRRP